ncbi:MAG: hypothetical protein AMK72_13820 [Planctomycetes bacterium SM23_25]|nr:MAG: hypothetical protein AMK72_13820 [Planctomycetes bacterium SM23_25]
MRPVERLLAETVAGEQQPPGLRVPEGKGEHAHQPRQEVRPVVLVQVDEDLGVAGRGEPVAARFQTPAKGAVVVDLAVVGQVQRVVFVGHGLMAAGRVDDRQPPDAQPGAAARVDPDALLVRAAMHQGRDHAAEDTGIDRGAARADDAGDAAHEMAPPGESRAMPRTVKAKRRAGGRP